jgi:hypothetical protein
MGIPDMRFINRRISITDVAKCLDLRYGNNGLLHCWRPELHQNGDRTASVSIHKRKNYVKCFGCSIGRLGPIDLVMSVLDMQNPGAAARWIAERFVVPDLPRGRHLVRPERKIFQFGFESPIGLLVQSGLWAELSLTARSLVPVFLELAERIAGKQELTIKISYRSLARFSGVASPNAIRKALRELMEIHWLSALPCQPEPSAGPIRETKSYLITPRSDELVELAHAHCTRLRNEIDIQKVLRAQARQHRKNSFALP